MNLNRRIKWSIVTLSMCIAVACAPKPMLPNGYVAEFWKNILWQRYEALPATIDASKNKEFKKWMGPKKKPGIRILESQIDSILHEGGDQTAGPTTATVTLNIRYFKEAEYVEQVTEVTQIWERKAGSWFLTSGFPFDFEP